MHRTQLQAFQHPWYPICQIRGGKVPLKAPLRWCTPSVRSSKLAARASENTPSTEEVKSTDEYRLQHDAKSIARSMLEGKSLLSREKEEVEEEEARERFVGRLIVLVLGVRCIPAPFHNEHFLNGAVHSNRTKLEEMCHLPKTKQPVCKETGTLVLGCFSHIPFRQQSSKCFSLLQAVLLGERITGKGAVQALDHAVGVPLWEIEPFLGAMVVGLLIAALYPRRKQLVEGAQKRQKQMSDWLADAQVWVRRLACVSLASTIVVEVVTGKVCSRSTF